MSDKTKRESTNEMHDDLYRAYLKVIDDYGDHARYIPKKVLIADALNEQPSKFHIGEDRAKRIINQKIKESGK